MNEIHDTYYSSLTDPVALAKELEKYMGHIQECLSETGLSDECVKDLKDQLNAAKVVRENIRRVFDE